MLHLITGGARSGKSSHAEQLARAHAGPIHYLATAAVGDAEMAHRVVMHQARRPVHWRVIECGAGLPAALEDAARPDGLVLVDCLTLWLVHFLEQPAAFMAARQTLLDTLAGVPGGVLL
ncbi:bifunctional adenosylcobinamide kinase/adenosylcobinamide-phosphate guanylyltransferase, partial [Laribacter hongkongensis]|uniref:bifunctional adenosylcobinamide kinase/adenosylcobinamide-phosphate guanylyltransferase n=1 Tax=Laribacter hongkongensis TaxID=168471 RepID=UPI001EFC8BC5